MKRWQIAFLFAGVLAVLYAYREDLLIAWLIFRMLIAAELSA